MIYKKKLKFYLEIAHVIEYDYNRDLKSTGYKQNELRNTNEKELINTFILNIIKSKHRKINNFKHYLPNTLLLICKDNEFKRKRYILKRRKKNIYIWSSRKTYKLY